MDNLFFFFLTLKKNNLFTFFEQNSNFEHGIFGDKIHFSYLCSVMLIIHAEIYGSFMMKN